MSSDSAERRSEGRYKARLEVKLLFKASPRATSSKTRSIGEGLRMIGNTQDISETSVGLVVSARNIDRYVTSADYVMLLELMLPSGPITFTVSPTRHERFTVGQSANAYFIAAQITEISETARASLVSYLSTLS
jgi:hypothetical protein